MILIDFQGSQPVSRLAVDVLPGQLPGQEPTVVENLSQAVIAELWLP